jgi:hypothetical protein
MFEINFWGLMDVTTQVLPYTISIEDYKGTVVEQRLVVALQGGGQEAGDPVKAAQAIIDTVEAKDTPHQLLLGEKAYEGAYGKIDVLKKDFETWKDTTLSVDYE